jgi:hypothetical protein
VLLAFAATVFVTAWVARRSEGERELAASVAAGARGDVDEAIRHARTAAAARCPGCGASEAAYARLVTLAKEAEGRGDDARAVAAWRAVRAATLASLVLDHEPARRTQADAEIARVEHRLDLAAIAGGATPSPAATEERLKRTLSDDDTAPPVVFALFAIGAVLFAVGAHRTVQRGRASDVAAAAAGIGVAVAGALIFS